MGGFTRSFLWVNNYSKKQCKWLFGRVRAAMKKLAGKNKRKVKFQYDPLSYALNFDDGNFGLGDRERAFRTFYQKTFKLQSCSKTTTTTTITTIAMVYVLWVET
ncbi:unnamed protein product [Withania somnifera]